MSEDRAIYSTTSGQAQVTNYDVTAELLATWREKLPRVLTVQAHREMVRLIDVARRELERFEKSAAFVKITGAQ